eukprot:PLAT13381.1.p1 GENE.PLAT13381.1~~PLAT13381.1.p1  ORF type:complete len:593 (+),score=308.87 PLAT13381.1:38-1816(+)
MLVLATVAAVLSSSTLRSSVESLFAQLTVFVVAHKLAVAVALPLLLVALLALRRRQRYSMMTKPTAAELAACEKWAEVVVVGAGTAGASAALALANAGRKVVVIERNMGQVDRVVGELLQPGGLAALDKLGLRHCATEGADSVDVYGYAILDPKRDKMVLSIYPQQEPRTWAQWFGWNAAAAPRLDGSSGGKVEEAAGGPTGRSFHNCRFVHNLRRELLAHDNVRVVVGTVCGLLSGTGAEEAEVVGVTWKDADKQKHDLRAPLTLICDGAWSGLRRKLAPSAKPLQLGNFVGLLLRHEEGGCPLPARHHGHVLLADPTPILFYQISPTETRVLVDIPGKKMPGVESGEMEAYMREHVVPQLPSSLKEHFLKALADGPIQPCPNRTMGFAPSTRARAVLLGDSFNMRHPLTGGGMTVALKDVVLLRDALQDVDLFDGAAQAAALRGYYAARPGGASTVNILADALYAVFTSDASDPTRAVLRQACLEYLDAGGVCSAGPNGLLAGLTPKPLVLTIHFFMVAFHAMRLVLAPFPSPARLARAYHMLHVACKIIMPLIVHEAVTPLSFAPLRMLIDVLFPYSRNYKRLLAAGHT